MVLLGVSHVAEASFWEEVAALVADKESAGSQVHYEMVENDTGEAMKLGLDVRRFAQAAGMVFQKDGLPYPDHWLRTDMSLSEYLSHGNPAKIQKALDREDQNEDDLDLLSSYEGLPLLARRFFVYGMPVLHRLFWLKDHLGGKSSLGISHKITIDARNKIGVDAALSAESNVVAIWGAAHLPGMGKLLEQAGFIETDRRWLVSVDARKHGGTNNTAISA